MNSLAPLLFVFSILFAGCGDHKTAPQVKEEWQKIAGRSNRSDELYRVRVPCSWTRKDPPPTESLEDTKKALCEFFIEEGGSRIRILIHNFPSTVIEERIPSIAQATRWKRQFDSVDPVQQETRPQAFNGFAGCVYEGKGILDGEEKRVMGWALQLGSEHYRALSRPGYPLEMRADTTIKATGPALLMAAHRGAITRFARSFELIEEIPAE